LKKIDWYIIKKFLGTFFLSIALLIVIVVLFDVSEKIDDFLQNKAPLKQIIFVYYLNFIPYFINLFSPLFTFIAVIFFTSKLAANSEVIAILSSGISFNRMLLPYFASAFVLAVMTFYLANFVIPNANKSRYAFELAYIGSRQTFTDRDIHLQTEPGTFAYAETFNTDTKTGYNFTYEKTNDKGLYYKISSDIIRWDSLKNRWHLENFYIRQMNGMQEKIAKGPSKDTVFNNLKPVDFAKKYVNVATMNFFELRKFIKDEKMKGNESVASYEIEKYRRMVDPISLFIFTLIGVALSSRKVRGGMGFHLGAGIVISFAYILFMQITTTFSIYSNLPPVMGVWVPNIIFGILGIYLLRTAPK